MQNVGLPNITVNLGTSMVNTNLAPDVSIVEVYVDLFDLSSDADEFDFEQIILRINSDLSNEIAFIFTAFNDDLEKTSMFYPALGLGVTQNYSITAREMFETLLGVYGLSKNVMLLNEPGQYRITRTEIVKTV